MRSAARKRQLHRRMRMTTAVVLFILFAVFVTLRLTGGTDAGESAIETAETQLREIETEDSSSGEVTEGSSEETEEPAEEETEEDEETAAAQERMAQLQEKLEQMAAQMTGTHSIYVKDLNHDISFSIDNQQIYAASLIKLFVMEKCYAIYDDLVGSYGESYVEEELTSMITVSDNEAYNELVRMISLQDDFSTGAQLMNTYLAENDYTDTGLYSTLHPSSSTYTKISDTLNHTTVEDCGLLLERIYTGTCVSEGASAAMLNLLLQQETTYKIPAGVPDTVQVANKTGETSETQHDAAIVYGEDCTYILCVMSSDIADEATGISDIVDISALVYESLNPTTDEEDSETDVSGGKDNSVVTGEEADNSSEAGGETGEPAAAGEETGEPMEPEAAAP